MQTQPTWNSIGASGRQAGVDERVADFKMQRSRPPIASTQPAGTSESRSRPRPIMRYKPFTCQLYNGLLSVTVLAACSGPW